MRYSWLNQNGVSTCVLFMTGWGMDPLPFSSILNDSFDILMLSDYQHLEPVNMELLGNYEQCHLVAWSMGVWVAGHLLHDVQDHFTTRTAIGGTLDPIHPTTGIPPEAYDFILQNFTQELLNDFHLSMFTDQEEAQRFFDNRPDRKLDDLLSELGAFKEHYLTYGASADIFTQKIVTSRDRVFPFKNQLRAWGKKESKILKLPHFPFYALRGWEALVDSSL